MRQRPAVLLLALLGGLLPPSSAQAQAVRATDFRGREIALAQPAQRIVCLIESALSGLYMLGAQDRVVGVSTSAYEESVLPYYAAMDPRLRDRLLPTPGNWDFVNLESLVSLKPDLVVIWSHQEESIRAIEARGIPVFGVFVGRFADIHQELRALGALTGTGARAEELLRGADQILEGIRRKTSGLPPERRARVYFMWAQGELETSGRPSTVQELIHLAGAENVAAGIDQEHLVVNLENVLLWNPGVIVMWHNPRRDPAQVLALSAWQSVAAVRQRRVYEFPEVFTCDLWTLKYLFAAKLVASWCYPELFDPTGLEKAQRDLLATLYGN